ncbi:hypothetical protein CXU20_01180 [Akkermansia muciniphila]|nr:hypothetical protein CXU20_01180 [Akkermansia muciniphila]
MIKTSTGIWTVVYNAANRAVSFTSRDGSTVVECGYDYQGRRYMKKVTVNGTVASHEHYLYRGYLQLAVLDMLDNRNVLRTLLWDPLEPVATRPLALARDNALYCYGVDFNKNVTEVFDARGTLAATYDYSPYGIVGSTGNLAQPVQWSSEMNDEELALVYYNYRYYNPADGRWINKDPLKEENFLEIYLKSELKKQNISFELPNLYVFCHNSPVTGADVLGLWEVGPRPPKINTVVTDGKGGLEVYLGQAPEGSIDRKCCLDCLMKHEQSHLSDILAANPRIAFDDKGKPYPAGRGIVSPTHGRELIESEIKAHGI